MREEKDVLERDGSGADWRQANQHIFKVIPESVGPRLITLRGGAVHSVRPPGSHIFKATGHFMAVMLAPAPGNRASLGSDKTQEYDATVGAIVINPADVESRVAWSSTRENIVLALTRESLFELALHEFDSDLVELQPPPFGTVDLRALEIAQLLKAELTQDVPPNELYVDSLVTLSGVHLLRTYTSRQRQPARFKGGLSPTAARRVRDYLGETFTRQVSVAELASVCGYSPSHFIGAFTKSFGMPPHRYLVNLRLDFAERLLADGEIATREIAFLSGFSSQGHMAATMKQYRGRSPSQVRFSR
ncbi:helix-turn-helix transcriptional regulator [Mesorhizobium captivum]|uniref:helix-turn-helix transcriptional regulator n=1 Tax=Mesorhizobium captivum TaxID=3072319 RepID=UPI002A23A0B3|nr:AraC family transcriptional regulator [Mesorhizobium sp. VK23E]MDX8512106.1 AraC family transcriptional regulator [Mesorhizobium sp. VK23E]